MSTVGRTGILDVDCILFLEYLKISATKGNSLLLMKGILSSVLRQISTCVYFCTSILISVGTFLLERLLQHTQCHQLFSTCFFVGFTVLRSHLLSTHKLNFSSLCEQVKLRTRGWTHDITQNIPTGSPSLSDGRNHIYKCSCFFKKIATQQQFCQFSLKTGKKWCNLYFGKHANMDKIRHWPGCRTSLICSRWV